MTDAEYTAAVDNGTYTKFVTDEAGYGIAQWTFHSRKKDFLEYVKSLGKSIGDLEAQLGFLMKELRESFKSVFTVLKTATSVRTASDAVLLNFERPKDQSNKRKEERAAYGQGYFNKYAKETTLKKEDSVLNLVQSILTKNPCYTAGRKITVKGLMLHSVGCSQPSASVFIKNWNSPNYSNACVHGFIDANDGTAYQTLPWDHRGWHAGGSANNTHIGVEMCEPSCIKYTSGANFTCSDREKAVAAVKRTYETAVQLYAMLCKQFNLNPLADGVIISHKEGCARGVASNHGDPEHLWSQLKTGYTMNGFRNDVKAAMNGVSVITQVTPSVSVETAVSYQVRISISDLNIRSQPSSASASKGFITPGVYTIVSEATGAGATKWGKLKSGVGWVSLDYCTRIETAPAQTVSELDQAVDKLAKLGVINSPDYWKKAPATFQYLDDLIIKASVKIIGVGPRSSSVTVAIDQLVKDGIINSPEYWRANYQKCPSLDALLCALAGAKKG